MTKTTTLSNAKRIGVGLALAGMLSGSAVVLSQPAPAEAAGLSKSTCKSASKTSYYLYKKAKRISKKSAGVRISGAYTSKVANKCSRKQIKKAASFSYKKYKAAKNSAKRKPSFNRKLVKNKWSATYTHMKRAYRVI